MAKTPETGPEPEDKSEDSNPDLTTALEKLCFIIIKAREFDAKEAPVDDDPGSNPSDDKDLDVLEDLPDDTTYEELSDALDGLNDDEKVEVLALVWLGRGDYTAAEWDTALAEAEAIHNTLETSYLLGTPQLGDLLEEGLAQLDYSCEAFQINRL